jgi:hypothetical protein
MSEGERPKPGGWNRIHLIVDDITSEIARLKAKGVQFRNELVTGPGGSQILLTDIKQTSCVGRKRELLAAYRGVGRCGKFACT